MDDVKVTLDYDLDAALAQPKWTDGYQQFAGGVAAGWLCAIEKPYRGVVAPPTAYTGSQLHLLGFVALPLSTVDIVTLHLILFCCQSNLPCNGMSTSTDYMSLVHVGVPYEPGLCVLIDVRSVVPNTCTSAPSGWALLPVFEKAGKFVASGVYHLPLFQGVPAHHLLMEVAAKGDPNEVMAQQIK